MNKLSQYLVESILNEVEQGITVMLPGGFKPPHEGHFQLAKGYANMPQVKEVVILIGPKDRDGITVEDSEAIWKMLIGGIKNIRVERSRYPSPLLTAYKFIEEKAQPGETYALGSSSKGSDYDRIRGFVDQHQEGGKYFKDGVAVVELPLERSEPINYRGRTDNENGKPMSASQLRADLANGDFNNFKTNYPSITVPTQLQNIYDLLSKKKNSNDLAEDYQSTLDEAAIADFVKKAKDKFKEIIKAVKDEGTDTKKAFSLLLQAASGQKKLTTQEKEQVGNQMKEALKAAGLIAASVLPGGTIYFILVRLFRLENTLLPQKFLSKNATSVGTVAAMEESLYEWKRVDEIMQFSGRIPYHKHVEKAKSIFSNFLHKLETEANRDQQRAFELLVNDIDHIGPRITRTEEHEVGDALRDLLKDAGWREIIDIKDDRHIARILQDILQIPKFKQKVSADMFNESVLHENAAVMAGLAASTIAATSAMRRNNPYGGGDNWDFNPIGWFRDFLKDRKLQKIAKRLVQDPEIQKLVKDRTIIDKKGKVVATQELNGIQALLKNKLKPEELQYLRHGWGPRLRKAMKLTENRQLLKEGGAAGHMPHPYEDLDMTFQDIEDMIDAALSGKVEYAQEKLDGQNLMMTYKDGQALAARRKTQFKDKAELAYTKSEFEKSNNHLPDNVQTSFNEAFSDMAAAMNKLTPTEKEEFFGGGSKFVNFEILHPKTPNAVAYGVSELRLHNISEYDEAGNIVGEDVDASRKLAQALAQVEAQKQGTYTIKSTDLLSLKQTKDYEKQKEVLIAELNKLRGRYNLSKESKLGAYFQNYWHNYIKNNAKTYNYDIPENVLQNLVNRWAFGAKDPNLGKIKKSIENEEFLTWLTQVEGKADRTIRDQKKIAISPVQDIFLKLGVFVLDSIEGLIAINPNQIVSNTKRELSSAIEQIKQQVNNGQIGDDDAPLRFLKSELSRIERLGGFDAIVPTEGIIFKHKGKVYKLTGTFAPINQIIGYIKFGR